MNKSSLALSLAAALTLGAAASWAEPASDAPVDGPGGLVQSVIPSSQGDSQGADLLGAPFENESAGLSLRLPTGLHRVRSTGTGDDIGQFGDSARRWQLKLTRIILPQPTALASATDNFGKPIPGLVERTATKLMHDMPGCKILRQDMTNIRDGDPKVKDNAGMIAVRYSAAGGHYLTQQAIIQSNDRLFFLMALTTPGSNATGDDADNDPAERTAVQTFAQMLDSVHLLDTAKIREEQNDRLVRTRALMVNWTAARLHAALIENQWLRVLRNGKDIGYSYITEQTAAGVPRPLKMAEVKAGKSDSDLVEPGDGVLIGIRARSLDPDVDVIPGNKAHGPIQVDSATWLFVTPDRRLEDWSRVIVVDDGAVNKEGKKAKRQTEEFGSSSRKSIRQFDPKEIAAHHQPTIIGIGDRYTLNVTTVSGSGGAEPVEQELPPFYLPQALGQLLPRLLPLRPEVQPDGTYKPRKYMFASYVLDTRQVMLRYVDVGMEQQVTLAGHSFQAIPITDRIGYRGTVTTHYMSPEGRYLGSENKESHLTILPTDGQTLLSIWKTANLTRPGGVDKPQGAAQATQEQSYGPQPLDK
jgi:hypothetical protein